MTNTVDASKTTVRQLLAEIRAIATEVPAGLNRMRKPELMDLLASMRNEKRIADEHAAMLHAANAVDPEFAAGVDALMTQDAVPADVREVTGRYMGLEVTRDHDEVRIGTRGGVETMQALQAELEALPTVLRVEHTDDDAFAVYAILRTGAVDDWERELLAPNPHQVVIDDEFAAEVDALVARELAADPLPDTARRIFEQDLPTTETNVEPSSVAVIVQSGSKLIWGKLISVVNRRTRYSPPFLVTVELESGLRQLVAADDVLAA